MSWLSAAAWAAGGGALVLTDFAYVADDLRALRRSGRTGSQARGLGGDLWARLSMAPPM